MIPMMVDLVIPSNAQKGEAKDDSERDYEEDPKEDPLEESIEDKDQKFAKAFLWPDVLEALKFYFVLYKFLLFRIV